MTQTTRTILKAWEDAGYKGTPGGMKDLIDTMLAQEDLATDVQAGALSATDKVVSPGNLNAVLDFIIGLMFGDGSDGDVVISSNTSLSRDMYYNNLTVNAGVTLTTAGYRVFVAGTLTNNGTISNGGGAGGAGVNGAGGGAGGSAGTDGTHGGLGSTGAATANFPANGNPDDGGDAGGAAPGLGAGGTNASNCLRSTNGVAGTAGGTGAGGAGSSFAAGTSTALSAAHPQPRSIVWAWLFKTHLNSGTAFVNYSLGASNGGAGGGGGGALTFGGGGGGGGSGGNGRVLWLAAKFLVNNGVITAAGGNGGNGGNAYSSDATNGGGGGAGGTGGNGGIMIDIALTRSGSGTFSVAGGTPGAGGTGKAAGAAGNTGRDGVRYSF